VDDERFMQRAIALARRGEGRVEPNPMVGCVIARSRRVVGESHHKRFGGPHAEIEALRQAGRAARGATAYVTLEPCAHHGKTPPCADALIEAGLRRVVIAMRDPFRAVAGRGIRRLRAAGIDVQVGLGRESARQVLAPYLTRLEKLRPWVIAKWAQTLDGATATRGGDSRWISNGRSRREVHKLRARVDAVIVGRGTVAADDPELTARDVRLRRTARRVAIDPAFKTPFGSRLVKTLDRAPLTVAVSREALRRHARKQKRFETAGAEILPLPWRRGGRRNLDVSALLKHLAAEHHATNVLVEGGAYTHGVFFAQGCVDEAWTFIAPRLLGDERARPAVATGQAVTAIADAVELTLLSQRRLDDDLWLRYRVG